MFSPKAVFSTFSLPDAIITDSKLTSGHDPPSSDESHILNQEIRLPPNEEACFTPSHPPLGNEEFEQHAQGDIN